MKKIQPERNVSLSFCACACVYLTASQWPNLVNDTRSQSKSSHVEQSVILVSFEHIAEPLPPLWRRRCIFSIRPEFETGFAWRLRWRAPSINVGFVVRQYVFKSDIRVGHPEVGTLRIEDFDESRRGVSHFLQVVDGEEIESGVWWGFLCGW